jgi:hypothetical protein
VEKEMKRKLFAIVTILMAITCAFTALTACSPDNGVGDGGGEKPAAKELAFELNSDNASYKVTGFKGDAFGDIVIPDTYEGKPVTVIASDAFKAEGRKVRTVIVGKNVEIIESGAFAGAANLTSFKFADDSKIKTIKTGAIEAGTSFESLILPVSLEKVEGEAFFGCDNVKIYLEVETAPAGFEEGWDLIDFDTYGKKTVKADVIFKGAWSLVNGIPVKNA